MRFVKDQSERTVHADHVKRIGNLITYALVCYYDGERRIFYKDHSGTAGDHRFYIVSGPRESEALVVVYEGDHLHEDGVGSKIVVEGIDIMRDLSKYLMVLCCLRDNGYRINLLSDKSSAWAKERMHSTIVVLL